MSAALESLKVRDPSNIDEHYIRKERGKVVLSREKEKEKRRGRGMDRQEPYGEKKKKN